MEKQSGPSCIGIIMDGNRRFATDQGQDTFYGHKQGEANFYESVKWIKEAGIKHAIYYAFSTENWNRDGQEVSYLMAIFEDLLDRISIEANEQKVGVRIVGQRRSFSDTLQTKMAEAEARCAQYSDTIIWVALSYGGRTEIVEAVNRAVAAGREVDEASFGQLLYTAEMPDPDLIIRTGGEQRLSNFLPWQSVYSELFFTPTYWPAFTKDEFTSILAQYGKRQRRHGV